jgi:hypothetical protein
MPPPTPALTRLQSLRSLYVAPTYITAASEIISALISPPPACLHTSRKFPAFRHRVGLLQEFSWCSPPPSPPSFLLLLSASNVTRFWRKMQSYETFGVVCLFSTSYHSVRIQFRNSKARRESPWDDRKDQVCVARHTPHATRPRNSLQSNHSAQLHPLEPAAVRDNG